MGPRCRELITQADEALFCAAAADEILEALAMPRPVDWLGNAWGGHFGVHFAAAYPQACRSLLTIASPIRGLSPKERRPIRLAYYLYRLDGPRLLAAPLTDELLGKRLRESNPKPPLRSRLHSPEPTVPA